MFECCVILETVIYFFGTTYMNSADTCEFLRTRQRVGRIGAKYAAQSDANLLRILLRILELLLDKLKILCALIAFIDSDP